MDKIFDFCRDNFQTADFLKVKLNGEIIEFLEFSKYEGPVTLQLLPFGGIQSFFNNLLIINTKDGFMSVSKLKYQGKILTSKEFIESYGIDNLANKVFNID